MQGHLIASPYLRVVDHEFAQFFKTQEHHHRLVLSSANLTGQYLENNKGGSGENGCSFNRHEIITWFRYTRLEEFVDLNLTPFGLDSFIRALLNYTIHYLTDYLTHLCFFDDSFQLNTY